MLKSNRHHEFYFSWEKAYQWNISARVLEAAGPMVIGWLLLIFGAPQY